MKVKYEKKNPFVPYSNEAYEANKETNCGGHSEEPFCMGAHGEHGPFGALFDMLKCYEDPDYLHMSAIFGEDGKMIIEDLPNPIDPYTACPGITLVLDALLAGMLNKERVEFSPRQVSVSALTAGEELLAALKSLRKNSRLRIVETIVLDGVLDTVEKSGCIDLQGVWTVLRSRSTYLWEDSKDFWRIFAILTANVAYGLDAGGSAVSKAN